jgi:hypothetical protein
MPAVGFRVKGKVGLEEIKNEINASFSMHKFQDIMEKASKIAYDEACRLCPVADPKYANSGAMKAAIQVEYDGYLTYSLECNVPYASFNEYGWRGIPKVPLPPSYEKYMGGYRPFMRIGILKAEKYINRELGKAFAQANKYAHGGANQLPGQAHSKPKMQRKSWE